ncbi:hypothetical protein CIHG_09785 [Coccidioides immitis H538.4]|uniref:Uncharacterized protein n=3 Tax=Coccidioides immitis TaxID=5501 RepID=A0A0J8QV79_COCIT|nr:hypothetical protein CIRG_06621 [Coccidioides immitis RMSCC 2394]KMU75173.1 hypothetical protein CISG_04121 [Coccidioides immitis RMSCC 3703]KMU92013.1 hypothetical protein CIHG_09785 [Coccidioides immitis H538.4]
MDLKRYSMANLIAGPRIDSHDLSDLASASSNSHEVLDRRVPAFRFVPSVSEDLPRPRSSRKRRIGTPYVRRTCNDGAHCALSPADKLTGKNEGPIFPGKPDAVHALVGGLIWRHTSISGIDVQASFHGPKLRSRGLAAGANLFNGKTVEESR